VYDKCLWGVWPHALLENVFLFYSDEWWGLHKLFPTVALYENDSFEQHKIIVILIVTESLAFTLKNWLFQNCPPYSFYYAQDWYLSFSLLHMGKYL
jgi:hypothetical protein